MIIRQPRLLSADLTERARLAPVKLSLHLTLTPTSTAEMVLPDDAPDVVLRDLVELYDENGSAGIFRVTQVSRTLSRTRTILLEHSLATLRDTVIPAQGFVSGVAECLSTLLNQQDDPRWTLGDVETPEDLTVIFATEYANLLDAVTALIGMLPEGYALAFDQTTFPWVLHLRRLTEIPDCEGRVRRNLQSVRIETDSSRLCTRVYPFGAELEEGRITLMPLTGSDHEDSGAQSSLGIISRTFESDLVFDVPTLQAVAQRYLDRHAQPETTIVLSAAELSLITGVALDRFLPGKLCRLCLPEIGLTLMERVIAVDKPDVYTAPGQAVVTLSNRLKQQTDAAEIDEIVRQVTAGKLLGGSVTEITEKNRAHGTFTSPVVHPFIVEDWAALLDVRVAFQPDTGATMRSVRVDGTSVDNEVWKGRSFSAMPYLRHDELGQIARGEHVISFSPYGDSAEDSVGVSSTVTLTVITDTIT